MVETIRGLVRPIVTFLVILALVVIVCFLVFKYANVDMATVIISGFMTLVASVTGFWFGSRKTGGEG